MINKVKSNYIYLIFLIPLFPHYETNLSNIHFDDIPIILYLISFMFFVNKKITQKNYVKRNMFEKNVENNLRKKIRKTFYVEILT